VVPLPAKRISNVKKPGKSKQPPKSRKAAGEVMDFYDVDSESQPTVEYDNSFSFNLSTSSIGVSSYILKDWEQDSLRILRKIKEHEFIRIRPIGESGYTKQTAIANFFSPVVALYPAIAQDYLSTIK